MSNKLFKKKQKDAKEVSPSIAKTTINSNISSSQVEASIIDKLSRHFGASFEEATKDQIYKATAITVKDILLAKKREFKQATNKSGGKRIYYLCMEFLVGRSLKNNLYNLGLTDVYSEILKKHGYDLNELFEMEPDAGLGNGGLGRLAACFMDSLASLNYPATGFSILYEYGLFRQKIVEGRQMELPDV